MADVMPDYHVEQQRLNRQIRDQESRIEADKLSYLEAEKNKKSALLNIAAHQEELTRLNGRLKSLEKEHGKQDIDWDSLVDDAVTANGQETDDG